MILRKTLWTIAIQVLIVGACTFLQAGLAADPRPSVAGSGPDALANKAKTAEALFGALDEDGTGQVDRAEWRTRKMAIFYMRDANNDVQLGRDELPGLAQDRFGQADFNMDGFLSGYEFNQAPFSQFDKADADGDGSVTASEFRAYMAPTGAPR